MNKTTVAQQAKTASFLPPARGILQRNCACGNHAVGGGECAECTKKKSGLQLKLAIGASNDPLEQEADRVADQVLTAPRHSAVSNIPLHIQRYAGRATQSADSTPNSVDHVLASSGKPLEPALRQDMEQRFGHDFSQVRVHIGAAAEQSARDVNAHAYTVGKDVVFGQGKYMPESSEGRRLISHELVHVIQQNHLGFNNLKLFRFVRRERDQIGDLDDAIVSARNVADDTGMLGLMRWGRFTAAMGGVGGFEYLTSPKSGSTATTPFPRYLYTCRCGLIDLRHFYQLMYIANLRNEETAVEKGIEHEKTAEPESSYAPEDITSNALGAEFGSQRSWTQKQSTFVSSLRTFLSRCAPIEWLRSDVTSQQRDCVVDFYAVDAAGASHRRREAGVSADSCGICAGDISFPFTTDPKTGTRIM